jgi:hypothetical protein
MDISTQDRLQDQVCALVADAHEQGASEKWLREEFDYQVKQIIEEEGEFEGGGS